MFNIGDRVVYPMYGAGIIEALEEKPVDGVLKTYYVLKITYNNLKISLSVDRAEERGFREITDKQTVLDIIYNTAPINMPSNWNVRYQENLARIKGGDLTDVVRVYKTLTLRERIKSLSSIEKKMLTNTRQIVTSEIMLSQNIDKTQAEALLQAGLMNLSAS